MEYGRGIRIWRRKKMEFDWYYNSSSLKIERAKKWNRRPSESS